MYVVKRTSENKSSISYSLLLVSPLIQSKSQPKARSRNFIIAPDVIQVIESSRVEFVNDAQNLLTSIAFSINQL